MERSPQQPENEPITLERATAADLATFMRLEETVRNAKTYPSSSTEQEFRDELAHNEVYFIKKGSEIVGNIEFEMKSNSCAELTGMMVAPLYQSQGIGTAALTQMLEKLRAVERIELVTHPENERALALYQSLGFRIESRVENYEGTGEPRLVLARTN